VPAKDGGGRKLPCRREIPPPRPGRLASAEEFGAAEKSRRPGRLASAEEFGPPAKYAPTAHWIKPVSLSYHRPPALPAGFSFPANATIELLVDYIDSGGTGKPAVAY